MEEERKTCIPIVGFWCKEEKPYQDGQEAVTTKKRNHNQCEDLMLLLAWKTSVLQSRNQPQSHQFHHCCLGAIFNFNITPKNLWFWENWVQRARKCNLFNLKNNINQFWWWELLHLLPLTAFSVATRNRPGTVSPAPPPMTSPVHSAIYNQQQKQH